MGNAECVSVTYANLHNELGPGCRILGGRLASSELLVEKVEGHNIVWDRGDGCPLSNNKSINIPNAEHPASLADREGQVPPEK